MAEDAATESKMEDVDEPIFDPSADFSEDLFVHKHLAEPFFCIECTDVPRDPYELECGHGTVCKNDGPKVNCEKEAECKLPANKVERMNGAGRRKIKQLEIKCLRYRVGCDWVGIVRDWDSHVQDECQFAKVPCMECAVDGVPSIHVRMKDLGSHKSVCPKFECALKKNEINCPSGGRMTESEFNAHRQQAYLDHIDALGESLRKSKLNLEDRVNMLQEQNRTLQEEVDKLKQEAEEREEKMKNTSNELDGFYTLINDMNARLAGCEFVNGLRQDLPPQQNPEPTS